MGPCGNRHTSVEVGGQEPVLPVLELGFWDL